MKITDWKLIKEVPNLIQRARELGFSVVKVRQLAFNRQEFCLVAVKDKFELRIGKKRAKQNQQTPANHATKDDKGTQGESES